MKFERKIMKVTKDEALEEKQTERPFPQCNQIWSAPSLNNERRYIRILRVRRKGTGYNYAKAKEVTVAGVALPSPIDSITVSLASGEMATAYKFESDGKDIS
jgi:hypothetical protein